NSLKAENPQLAYLIDEFILATMTYKLALKNKRGRGDPLLVGAKMEYDRVYQKLDNAFMAAPPGDDNKFFLLSANHWAKKVEANVEKPAQLPQSMIRNEQNMNK
ncbi:hypothetical protein ROZALSC1DRAFT_25667, partial [Rozella allomycis CSF55]